MGLVPSHDPKAALLWDSPTHGGGGPREPGLDPGVPPGVPRRPPLGSGVFLRPALGRRCFCSTIKVCGDYRMVTWQGVAHKPSVSELCCGLLGPMAIRQG